MSKCRSDKAGPGKPPAQGQKDRPQVVPQGGLAAAFPPTDRPASSSLWDSLGPPEHPRDPQRPSETPRDPPRPPDLFTELWLEALTRAGEGTLHTTGHCMLPALEPGRRVVVERLPEGRYRPGDVIVYRGESSLVAHRVVGSFSLAGAGWVVHRGDNSSVRAALPRHRILGRVVAVVEADGVRTPVNSAHLPRLLVAYFSAVAALRALARRLLRR